METLNQWLQSQNNFRIFYYITYHILPSGAMYYIWWLIHYKLDMSHTSFDDYINNIKNEIMPYYILSYDGLEMLNRLIVTIIENYVKAAITINNCNKISISDLQMAIGLYPMSRVLYKRMMMGGMEALLYYNTYVLGFPDKTLDNLKHKRKESKASILKNLALIRKITRKHGDYNNLLIHNDTIIYLSGVLRTVIKLSIMSCIIFTKSQVILLSDIIAGCQDKHLDVFYTAMLL